MTRSMCTGTLAVKKLSRNMTCYK